MKSSNRSRRSRWTVTGVGLAALILLATACGGTSGSDGAAEQTRLRYATFLPDSASFSQDAQWWMDRVGELTDSTVEFRTYFSESLLPAAEHLNGVRDGRVELAMIAPPYSPQQLPLSQIAGVPFLTENGEAAARAVKEMYETNQTFNDEWSSQGVRPLAWSITTNLTSGLKEPVASVDELRGKRLRSTGLAAEALRVRDIEPVNVTGAEIYEAVERGVADGFSASPFQNGVSLGLHDVAPHFLDLGFGNFALIPAVAISERAWNDLPETIQDAMTQAGEEMFEFGLTNLQEQEEQACDTLLAAGGSASRLPDAEIESWKADAVAPLLEQWKTSAVVEGVAADDADAFVNDYRASIEKFEAESAFIDGLRKCVDRSE